MEAARSPLTVQTWVNDIIPYVDRHFRTQASREGRALAGLSMGGFVVIHTGLSRLDTFSELYVYSSGQGLELRVGIYWGSDRESQSAQPAVVMVCRLGVSWQIS